MALYTEIYTLSSDATLIQRFQTAVVVAAAAIMAEDTNTVNHGDRMRWASKVLSNPIIEGQRALWIGLAQNTGLTTAQIQAATDAQLQAVVAAAVNILAG